MTDPELARKIETTGWTTAVLGFVCVGLSAVQVALPKLLAALSASLDSGNDPTRAAREAYASGAGLGALVNLIFGLGLISVGIGVAQRRKWAHPALTIASWASIAALLAMAQPSVAPLVAMAGGGTRARAVGIGISVILLAAQIIAVLWFLRFWGRPEVRAAFRTGS